MFTWWTEKVMQIRIFETCTVQTQQQCATSVVFRAQSRCHLVTGKTFTANNYCIIARILFICAVKFCATKCQKLVYCISAKV